MIEQIAQLVSGFGLSHFGGNARVEHVAAGQTNVIILDGIDTNVTTLDATDFIFV